MFDILIGVWYGCTGVDTVDMESDRISDGGIDVCKPGLLNPSKLVGEVWKR